MSDYYPFAALQGQEAYKEALLIAAVNPRVGGVLARGEKGTAKSTAARGLIEILPEISARPGCPYRCDPAESAGACPFCRAHPEIEPVKRPAPFLTLPLNATEDRVTGGLDFEAALASGEKRNAPGLLAEAHRGILYIDEANLLDDHIVDAILDAAASGWNVVEREGLSERLPARFILIGTMNPEEGEPRPQFLDRFGLSVAVAGLRDPAERVELMLAREKHDRDPALFRRAFAEETRRLRQNLQEAQKILPSVRVPARVKKVIAALCAENRVAGHRADLFLAEAARAKAALAGQLEVSEDIVLSVAPWVLAHRRREAAPPPPPPPAEDNAENAGEDNAEQSPEDSPEDSQEDSPEEGAAPETPRPEEGEKSAGGPVTREGEKEADSPEKETRAGEETRDETGEAQGPGPREEIYAIGATFGVRKIETAKDRLKRRGSGRRSRSRASQKQGRYVKSGPNLGQGDIALDATIRYAAPAQIRREKPPGLALALEMGDVRERIREKKMGNHLFFTVDASGSMGARGRMAASKGAIMSLLLDAYQKRDQVSLIAFRRREATVSLPLTASIDLAGKLLAEMPVGGRTPLSSALALTFRETQNALRKNPLARPIVIFITDGRGNVPLGGDGAALSPFTESLRLAQAMRADSRVKYAVVDAEEPGVVSFGLARELSLALGAEYFRPDDLKAQTLLDIVRANT
ncbi:MAG: ATP-binding protein [Deltaproteobacteria bacterium]|jgi:magnesium chelatase subunit D|nr:ATP-binding protein [Deltaproteobacteria bacterium]